MRVVQFEIPGAGRRVGVVVESENEVCDITSVCSDWLRVIDVFQESERVGCGLRELLTDVVSRAGVARLDYLSMLNNGPNEDGPFLHLPVDHSDPHWTLVSGTGLTHLGSMQSRDEMHTAEESSSAAMTDSKRMFAMGLAEGKPAGEERGVAPEWFYKGNGHVLRSHRQALTLPPYAGDGGEEAELAGCYVIDGVGQARRLGFALGNEWSDHATEKVNYLYLAPSKLRQCAIGPELILDCDFQEISLQCTVLRNGATIYDSGELWSGEDHMCHSLSNCEDHHFKFAQHRYPGNVHIHYFGTSKLSYGTRDWVYQSGDEISITSKDFSAPLVNTVIAGSPSESSPIRVVPA